jgi:hypothetical protein
LETGTLPQIKLIDRDWPLVAGFPYTQIAAGLLPGQALTPVLLADNNRGIATQVKFRIVHMSNVAGVVDVYIADTGQPITADDLTIVGLPIGIDTGYLALATGDYKVTLTATGDISNVVLEVDPITVTNGKVYTAIMVDTATGIAPVNFLFMDDFVP